jgi:hypothetical protein
LIFVGKKKLKRNQKIFNIFNKILQKKKKIKKKIFLLSDLIQEKQIKKFNKNFFFLNKQKNKKHKW